MGLIMDLVLVISLIMTCILFIVINLKTVRRLKKNPITKDAMGFHLIWGWYAPNISLALFVSKKQMTKRKECSHGFMFADPDLMRQYTTPFEKVICKLFVILGLLSVVNLFIIGILDQMGLDIFDY